MYDMPLNDAILLENGVYTRIGRIARVIEKDPTLKAKVQAQGKLTADVVLAAIAQAEGTYGSFAGRGAARSGAEGRDLDKALLRRQKLAGTNNSVWASIMKNRPPKGPGPKPPKPPRGGKGGKGRSPNPLLDYPPDVANPAYENPDYENGFKSGSFTIGRLGRRQIAAYLDKSGGLLRAYQRSAARKRHFWGKDVKLLSGTPFEKGGSPKYSVQMKNKEARLDKAKLAALWESEKYVAMTSGKDVNAARKIARQLAKKTGAPWTHEQRKGFNAAREMNEAAFVDLGRGAAGSAKARKAAGAQAKARRSVAKHYKSHVGATGRSYNNPFGYDDLALVTNPSGIGILDSIESGVSGVPVVGEFLAPVITPVAMGAAAFGAHFFISPYVEKALNAYVPAAAPFAYSITGLTAAGGCLAIAKYSSDRSVQNAAALLGGAAMSIGVALDLFRKYGQRTLAGDSDFGALALTNPGVFGGVGRGDEYGALALTNPGMFGGVGRGDEYGALALTNPGVFGDGMAYQLGPVGGLGFDSASHALMNGYRTASLADAYFSGPDFDAVEGEALLSGPSEFRRAAGAPPHAAAGAQRHQSNFAGRRFHRWGWLITLIGAENAQKIAALSPEERVKVIDALRKQALAAYQQTMASHQKSQAALAVGPAAFGPMAPAGAAAAPGVGDAFGYGALAVADF